MKTKYLDKEIELLNSIKRNNEISDCGQEKLNEFIAIKKQLLLHNVSQQRELLIEAFDLINVHDGDKEKIAKLVDLTLKSINCG